MRIKLSEYQVRKISEKLYLGASSPITYEKSTDSPLKIDWWESQAKKEDVNSERQKAAMLLYLELASMAELALLQGCFPARFECNDKKSLRPDKGVIKSFLDNKLVTHRLIGSQLVFDITDAGKLYARTAAENQFSK